MESRVFGIGLSKTGTTTLAACLQTLGIGPHKSYDRRLKKRVLAGQAGVEEALRVAERYRSFEDSPWYLLYRELDLAFPGSKFVLTTRRDATTHAQSDWKHKVRAGLKRGTPSTEFIAESCASYRAHNEGVIEYFHDRPDDLLVVCWEKGDEWQPLCHFLGLPVPDSPFPHRNAAPRYGTHAKQEQPGLARHLWRRARYQLKTNAALRFLHR